MITMLLAYIARLQERCLAANLEYLNQLDLNAALHAEVARLTAESEQRRQQALHAIACQHEAEKRMVNAERRLEEQAR